MLKNIMIGVAISLILMASSSLAAETDKKQLAVIVAEKWIALIDAGDYADSWQEAAAYFKAAISQEKLEDDLQAVLKPLGATISRKLKSATYKTSLPGMPDGEYVIIHYHTSFQNKKSAIETITTMLDKDGQWRVVGYFIK